MKTEAYRSRQSEYVLKHYDPATLSSVAFYGLAVADMTDKELAALVCFLVKENKQLRCT